MANIQQSNLSAFNLTITNPRTQKYLADVLGERKGSFVNNLTALVANNKTLQVCEPLTLMYAALKATALNLPLDPSLGFAYVIPFKTKKKVQDINVTTGEVKIDPKTNKPVLKEIEVTEGQFQIGYKGLKQLALRTKQYKYINATDVRQGELKSRNRLTGEIEFAFEEDDAKRLELPIIGYVSYFQLTDGYKSTFYMSKEEMEAHAKRYSQTYRSQYEYVRNSSKWTTDFDAMALKTVCKLNISKNGPMSVELADAILADQSVMRESEKDYHYEDNTQDAVSEAQAQAVADKFKDFADFEDVEPKAEK